MALTQKQFIKKILLLDAGFAFISGLTSTLAAGPLTELMGLNDTIYLTVLGITLMLYAADLAFVAFKAADKPLFVKLFFAADIAWIVGSVFLVIAFSSLFSTAGLILINISALAVAGFAISKYKGLRMQQAVSFQTA